MYTVLVTGVGAIIGYGIVRSLRLVRPPVRIVGADIYADAVGQKWCDAFEQAVRTDRPDHPEFIQRVVDTHRVDLVIPGIEQDAARMTLDSYCGRISGAKFALNDPDLVRVANDKWLTHLAQKEAAIPAIPSRIEGDFASLSRDLGLPFLLKPRRSYASKGIHRIESEADLIYWRGRTGANFMAQEIVGTTDSEFTTGVFGLGDGAYVPGISFRRRLSGEGATSHATVVTSAALDGCIERLVKYFKPIGPTNFQFRLHQSQFLLLEVNPRISASTSLRTAFGYNEAEMCVEYYLGRRAPEPREVLRGSAVRYIEDHVSYDRDNI